MKPSRKFVYLLAVVIQVMMFHGLRAQTTSTTLHGFVMDQTGSLLPDSSVVLVNQLQGRRLQVRTDKHGEFTFAQLPNGSYRLLASHVGFGPVSVHDLNLSVNDVRTLEIKLKVGGTQETVTVRADEILVNTDSAVSTTIDKNFVQDLPLEGRSFQTLLLLTPGVLPAPLSSSAATMGQFSVNGSRADANNFTVDGVSANNGVNPNSNGAVLSTNLSGSLPALTALGTTSNMTSVDGLQEFTLQTSNYSAEFGRQSGGQIQLATRSGSNAYHGAAFDYLRNELFDSRLWLNRTCTTAAVCTPGHKTKTRLNEFGGSFSGPVRIPFLYNGKDKTFFFFDYEGLRLLLPTVFSGSGSNVVVPSSSFRSKVAAANSPVAALLNIYPVGNGANADAGGLWTYFNGTTNSPFNTNASSIRVDQNLGEKMQLFARFSYAPSSSLIVGLPTVTDLVNTTMNTTAGLNWAISSKLVNEVRLNYSKSHGIAGTSLIDYGGATPIAVSTIDQPFAGGGPLQGNISLFYNNFGQSYTIGDAQSSYQRQYEFVDNLSYLRGGHSFRLGVDYRRLSPIYAPTNFYAGFSFYSAAAVLSSTPNSISTQTTLGEHLHYNNYGFYAEDSWKATSRMTLNYGLRWDINPPPNDESGLNPALVTGADNLATATLASFTGTPYKTYWTGLGPRFGMSYLVHSQPGHELVVRGGFGLHFDQGNSQASAGFSSYPFVASKGYYSGTLSFPMTTAQALVPSNATLKLPTSQTLSALNPNLQLPYTLQWNAALQQSFGPQSISITYVGSSGKRLLTTESLNNSVSSFSSTGQFQSTSVNPNFGVINYALNNPTSVFHSLQVKYQRPLYKGLQMLSSYSWSHSIDTVSNEVSAGTLARASSDFDIRSNLTMAIIYDLPKWQKSGDLPGSLAAPLKAIVNGWQFEDINFFHTGTPGDVTIGANLNSGAGVTLALRPDLVPNAPLWVLYPQALGGRRINPAAFAKQPLDPANQFVYSRQGSTPRNYVRLAGLYQLNTGIKRTFPLTGTMNLQFKAEQFNLLNHPNVGFYNLTYSGPTSTSFGIGSAANASANGTNALFNLGGPRSVQFSARLEF